MRGGGVEVDPSAGPSAAGTEGLRSHVRLALLAARTAPSAHNSQPWQFRVVPDGLELGWAAARELPRGDPWRSYLMTGLGAAAEAASLGMALEGRRGFVTWNLDDVARTVARIEPRTGGPPDRDRELASWMESRATTRLPFRGEQVGSSVLGTLVTEAAENQASLSVVTEPARIRRFADLVVEGTALNMADPAIYREFHGWLRFGRRERTAIDGLTGAALGFGSVRSRIAAWAMSPPAMGAWRSIGVHRWLAATQRHMAERCGAVCLLTTSSNQPLDLFAGGRVMLRVWLAATLAGLRVHPMTAPMDHAETRRSLAELFGVPVDAPMVVCFRVGFGPAGPPAPRRPLADLIEPHVSESGGMHDHE